MLEILGIFLGLTLGEHRIALAAEETVARVELHLDGALVAELDAPPWATDLDFGEDLEPHRLEAFAYDAAGRRVGESYRLVNHANDEGYGVTLALTGRDAGGHRQGRLLWQAVLGRNPKQVVLQFDGVLIEQMDMAGRFVLPAYDPAAPHVLEAEVIFEGGGRARASLAFGGTYGDRVTSALTSVPVASPVAKPWTKEQVAGAISRGGEALPVFSVAVEPGYLVLVKDERKVNHLRRLRRLLPADPAPMEGRPDLLGYDVAAISPRPMESHDGTFVQMPLGKIHEPAGLVSLLLMDKLRFRSPDGKRKRGAQALWDTVALAGRAASARNRPRAALLVIGERVKDASSLTAAQAARYLAQLRVPLFVWTPSGDVLQEIELPPSVRVFHGRPGLDELLDAVAIELASQTIVWVEGEHLPTELEIKMPSR